MGRRSQSRQARRAQERRQQQRPERGERGAPPIRMQPGRRRTQGGPSWSAVGAIAVATAAIIIFIVAVFVKPGSGSSASATATIAPGPTVAGIGCDQGMTGSFFHIHAHIAIYVKGKQQTISPDFGHWYDKDCLFWTHAHQDVNGIVHIESPNHLFPTIAQWYKVAQTTLPPAGDTVPQITPRNGEQEKVWVDQKPYHGNPMQIHLKAHTNVVIEFGPPWVTPKPFTFPSGL